MAKNNRKKKKAANTKTNNKTNTKTNNKNNTNTNNKSNTKNSTNTNKNNKTNTKTNTKSNTKNKKPQESPKSNNIAAEIKSKTSIIFLIPVILVLGYLPILMRTLQFDTHLEDYEWMPDTATSQIDVFLKIKGIVLIIIAVFMLVIMLIWTFAKFDKKIFKRLNSLPFYMIGGAILFVLLSGIFAENKPLLLGGSFENFESIFVTLSYFVVMIYSFLLFSQSGDMERDFRLVYRASLPGFLIVALIGYYQVQGYDLFKTKFGQYLFVSSEYLSADAEIGVGSGEYTTLHNVDYVSVYFAMWAVFFLIVFTMTSNIWEKIARGGLVVLAVYDMIKAGTDAGRLGFVAAIVVLLIMISIGKKKRLIATIVGIVVLVALAFIIPPTRNYIMNGIGWVDEDETAKYKIHHITIEDDGVYFDLADKEYSVAYSFDRDIGGNSIMNVELRDADGNLIEGEYTPRTSTVNQYYSYPADKIAEGTTIAETRYLPKKNLDLKHDIYLIRGIEIINKKQGIDLTISNEVDKTGEYYFLNKADKFVQTDGTEIVNAHVFPSKFFSGRGTLWNKTLPILKNYLIVGCGSGLFITAYPQNDYLGKMFGHGDYDVKPHNLYLQYWVEEGLPFLLLMLAFYVLYYIMVIKSFKTEEDKTKKRISLACMLAVTVFLVAGLAGDSMVVHSPVFWTFLGIGVAAGWKQPIFEKKNKMAANIEQVEKEGEK